MFTGILSTDRRIAAQLACDMLLSRGLMSLGEHETRIGDLTPMFGAVEGDVLLAIEDRINNILALHDMPYYYGPAMFGEGNEWGFYDSSEVFGCM